VEKCRKYYRGYFILEIPLKYLEMEGRSTHNHDPTVIDDSSLDIEAQVKNKAFQDKYRLPKDELLLKGDALPIIKIPTNIRT
jgi:hypothetical protein